MFHQGKLEKMTIRAFLPQPKPDEPAKVSDDQRDTYVVQVNPSTSSLSQLVNYANRQGQGESGSDAIYSSSSPSALEFEFLFDGTGAVPPPSEHGDVPPVGALASAGSDKFEVMAEIRRFQRVVYDFDGKIHRPRKVLLVWGAVDFAGALRSFNVQFTLFRPDGIPLRAVARCKFCEWVDHGKRARKENRMSPDLTHVREIREGDTLPLLAHRIYGDAALYLEVARVNKRVNFRRLEAGTRVILPPLDKRRGKEAGK